MIKISPSILPADFANLRKQVELVEMAGAEMLHIDVMDGVFVPNLTVGPAVVECLRRYSNLEFDVHLMIENPDKFIGTFVNAGADIVTVHAEATRHLHRTLQIVKEYGVKAGVALNPATDTDAIKYILDDVDMVLVMTVNPGFSGQTFIPRMIDKIKEVKTIIGDRNIDIQVDGGINLHNIYDVTMAGANVIVAGAAIYNAESPADMIKKFRESSAI